MGKLDDLRRATGGNVAESMGRGVPRTPPTHGASAPSAAPDQWTGVSRLTGAHRIPLDRIIRDPAQPREEFKESELAELAASIRARGILQPIRVRWDEGQGMYVVISGERRFRAASRAGLSDAPCVVHDGPLTESEILLDQLAENLIRLDLEPIEQAKGFRRLMEANGWSARRLAEELHIDHDKVNRAVRLLGLPESVQDAVAEGAIPPTTAFEITKLDDAGEQTSVAARVISEGLSREQVAETVRRATGGTTKGRGTGKGRARKVTARTFRTPAGRVTVENARGLTQELLAQALGAALDAVLAEGESEGRGEAA